MKLTDDSYTQDALGAIARCVKDVAAALTVMASVGFDPADNTTALVPSSIARVDYAASLKPASLKDARIGVLTTFFNRTISPETTPVNNAMDAFIVSLKAAGAAVIPISETMYNVSAILANYDTQ